MATVTTSIRTDAQLKQEADQLFTELGMNFSTAVNMFLRQAVRMQGLPFRPTREVPNLPDPRRNVLDAAVRSARAVQVQVYNAPTDPDPAR